MKEDMEYMARQMAFDSKYISDKLIRLQNMIDDFRSDHYDVMSVEDQVRFDFIVEEMESCIRHLHDNAKAFSA